MGLLILALAPLLACAHVAEVEVAQERNLLETDPGLRMRFTQHALDYMTQELLPKVLKSLSDVSLKGASGKYSNIDYRVWNVKINEVGVSQPGMTFQGSSGLELCLKGITANVSSAWFASWMFVSDAGMVNVVVPDGQLCAAIHLKTEKGLPKVHVSSLNVDLKLGPVHFSHSNLHWVMNAAAWLFQKELEELASSTITEQVSALVNRDVSRALDTLNLNIILPLPEVNDSLAVDLSVDSIETSSDYLQVDIRGATSLVNHTNRVCPFPHRALESNLPKTWSNRMAAISIPERTVECFLWLVNSTGMLSYTLWPAAVPENPLGLKLDTVFMSILAPGIKEVYPEGQWLVVTAEVANDLPSFDFQQGRMLVDVPMNFNFRRLIAPDFHYDDSEFVFSFGATILGSAELRIEPGTPQRLKAHATLLGAKDLKQRKSVAGPVDLTFASQLLAVIRQSAEDALNNDTFSKFVPLGDPSGTFALPEVSANVSTGGLYLLSDLKFKWDRSKVLRLLDDRRAKKKPAPKAQTPAPTESVKDPIIP